MPNHRYIPLAGALLAAVFVALAVLSCVGPPLGDGDDDGQYSESVMGLPYEGVWQIDSYKKAGIVIDHQGYFTAFDIPYSMIAAKLFGGKEITSVTGSMGNDRLEYESAVAQDGTVLYTIKPKTMFVTATVDGRQCRVSLYLSPAAGSTDDMSWGRLSKNGVMSLVLCVAQYAMDGGDAQPSSVKLTYTAMRK